MDILNIVLIVLIFVSLIVIIAIFGKNLKKFKQAGKSAKLRREMGESKEQKKGFSFGFVFSKISEFFVWLAETVIKGAKGALQNAHSGIIEMKNKKAKGKTAQEDKKDFVKAEKVKVAAKKKSKSLDEPIEKKPLLRKGLFKKKAKLKEVKEDLSETKIVDFKEEDDKKLVDFFQEKGSKKKRDSFKEEEEDTSQDQDTAKKGGFFNRINPFKKEEIVADNKKILTEESYNEFSDGVKKIDSSVLEQEDASIGGVVRPRKVSQKEINDDDELGVDRKILEKKILQKIASNPKDIEGYRQLGELYIKMENFDDAQSAYKFILKVSARDVDATRKLEKIKLLKRLK